MNNTKIKCPVCGSVENRSFCPVSSNGNWHMYKCKECLTHFQFPNMQKTFLYDENYFNGVGSDKLVNYSYISDFDQNIINYRVKKLVEKLRSDLKVSGKLNILDIGPGSGLFCIAAQKFGNAYAMDIENINEKIIRKNGYSANFSVINLEEVTKDKLSDFKNYFHIINISEVVEHLSFPDRFFENVAYIAQKNSVLFVQTGRSDSFISMMCREKWNYYRVAHSIIYSKKSITSLLKRSGFKVLFVKRDTESFSEVYNIIVKNIKGNAKRCLVYLFAYILGKCLPNFGRMQILTKKI